MAFMTFKIDKSKDQETLHEMFIKVEDARPSTLENSIFYSRIKNTMTRDLMRFTREQVDLRGDLFKLRDKIGEMMSERDIRNTLDVLMKKYNETDNNVGLIYHIESTRVDYGVPVMVMIKRDVIYVKKFVFRFKKSDMSAKVGR